MRFHRTTITHLPRIHSHTSHINSVDDGGKMIVLYVHIAVLVVILILFIYIIIYEIEERKRYKKYEEERKRYKKYESDKDKIENKKIEFDIKLLELSQDKEFIDNYRHLFKEKEKEKKIYPMPTLIAREENDIPLGASMLLGAMLGSQFIKKEKDDDEDGNNKKNN